MVAFYVEFRLLLSPAPVAVWSRYRWLHNKVIGNSGGEKWAFVRGSIFSCHTNKEEVTLLKRLLKALQKRWSSTEHHHPHSGAWWRQHHCSSSEPRALDTVGGFMNTSGQEIPISIQNYQASIRKVDEWRWRGIESFSINDPNHSN